MSEKAEVLAAAGAASRPARERVRWTPQRLREALVGYLFLLPNLLGMIVFLFVPLVASLYYSFTNADAFKMSQATINPTDVFTSYNYALTDESFRLSISNTGVFLVGFLPLSIIPALLLAVLLNARLPAKIIFRTAFFLPVVASVVGVSLLWRWLFQYNFGPVNEALRFVGLDRVHWLESPQWAMITVIVVAAWQSIGYNMVLFLAGLQAIPRQLYEAASVDGATEWTLFRRVTLPLLTPATFFVVITSLIKGFQVFAEPFTMYSGGGPANAVLTVVMALYFEAFRFFHTGHASAMAWLLFVVIFLVTLIQFRLSDRWVHYE